jgi:type IV pilus assembly protein PilQ
MKRLSGFHTAVLALFTGVVLLTSLAWGEVATLSAITLEQKDNQSTYAIAFSGDVHHQDFLMSNPSRVVVDLVGARNALEEYTRDGDGKLVKGVRTSQYKNPPDLVSRVVFDIEKGTKYRVEKKEGRIEVTFFGAAESKTMGADIGASSWEAPAPNPPQTAPQQWDSQPQKKAEADDAWAAPGEAQGSQPMKKWTDSAAPSSSMEEALLASRATTPSKSVAMGATSGMAANKPITLDVQGADIKTVLRSISEFSGANIIAGPEVEGPVTIHLVAVPWKEALETVLKANGYSYVDSYGIYRVQETEVIHQEEIAVVHLQRKKEEMQPLISKAVRLSYANAKEMATAVKDATTRRGSVTVEKGSNAVIINDIPDYANRVADLVVELDRKVAQVEIVAKLVDVDVEATREMGIEWDFLNIMSADINGNAQAVVGRTLVDPFAAFRVGTVQSWGDLMVAVDALEKENKANIVSHPRITTADNKEATILVGKEIPLIVSDEAGNPITELKKIGVILQVTPHVNSDRTITMDIHPEVSELSSQATVQGGVIISLTQADTRVIVQDGETAVIGGLINEVETKNEQGLPGLKDVPIFGNLFKYSNDVKKKRELIIFITPKVVS